MTLKALPQQLLEFWRRFSFSDLINSRLEMAITLSSFLFNFCEAAGIDSQVPLVQFFNILAAIMLRIADRRVPAER